MKIDSHHPALPVNQSAQEQTKVQRSTQEQPSGKPDSAVVTHLNRETGAAEQDVNSANVEAIREAIREGRLEIHPERIAESLIRSVQEDLLGG